MPPAPPPSMVWFYDMDALQAPAGVTRHALAMRYELAKYPDRVALQLATGRISSQDSLATWESWDNFSRYELPFSTRLMLRYWRVCQWPPITAWTGTVDWILAPAEYSVAKGKSNLAVTSHDIAQDLRWQPPRRKQLLEQIFRSADKVFSVSRFNTSELLNAFPFLEGRVANVPNAADELFHEPATDHERAELRRSLGLPARMPYLLSVANFQPRKNLERLVRAVARMPAAQAGELALVLIGEGADHEVKRLLETIQSLNLPKFQIKLPGYVQGVTLRAAYAEATALVFPSLCESFGIPVLEAMTQNCPVAVANNTCLPEIAQDAGWYFEPTSEEAIVATVQEMLEKPALRQERIALGRQITAEYRWEKSARKLMEDLGL